MVRRAPMVMAAEPLDSGGCKPAPKVEVVFKLCTSDGRERKLRLHPGDVPVSSLVGFLDSVIRVRPKGRHHRHRKQRKGIVGLVDSWGIRRKFYDHQAR